MKTLSIIAVSMIAFCLAACANSASQEAAGGTRAIEVKEFDKIRLTGAGTMTFRQKPGPASVKADIPETMRDRVTIEVKNGTLCVDVKARKEVKKLRISPSVTKRTETESYERIAVSVTAPALRQLDAGGAWNFDISGKLDAQTLRVSTTGSCKVNGGELVCSDLRLTQKGACGFALTGVKSKSIDIEATGSCKADLGKAAAAATAVSTRGACTVKAAGLEAQTLTVSASGACKTEIDKAVVTTADIKTSGSCKVRMPSVKASHIKAATTGGCKTTLAGNAATAFLRAASFMAEILRENAPKVKDESAAREDFSPAGTRERAARFRFPSSHPRRERLNFRECRLRTSTAPETSERTVFSRR